MIEYIKEYGVTNMDYDYIVSNIPKDIMDIMTITENSVRDVLDYYNTIGLSESVGKIIIKRPDLIIIDKKVLEELISKIEIKTFVNIVKSSIDDLIILGI
ncbi:MAG: hypothetical protein HFI73_00820 [Bacilli bacterium]|jgi:hypothetical protein|nr:hypothetical protein [Bacilli bacterium]